MHRAAEVVLLELPSSETLNIGRPVVGIDPTT
jgi:hypothetical protein